MMDTVEQQNDGYRRESKYLQQFYTYKLQSEHKMIGPY